MEAAKLIEVLRATIDPQQQKQAQDHLNQVNKIIGFAPSLLQVLMMNEVDLPIRQAGVIYLKNMINQFWEDPGEKLTSDPVIPFSIHEQDRAMIRDSIVDAVILAPSLIQVQLCVCVNTILKHDFPYKWSGIVDKVSIYLQNTDLNGWQGALLCLYQLVKNFEYKKPDERGPLTEAMHLLLPMIHQRCLVLASDPSEQSVLLQKQILKIYFALVQYFLPLDLISKETFTDWMNLLRTIVARPVPEEANQVDEEDRPELPWWKCKKWSVHILQRIFERFGSPGCVTKEYKEFSVWYLNTFSEGIMKVLLSVLDGYVEKKYVSPRVLHLTLSYMTLAVNHAVSWAFLKPHMKAILQEVIFPLLRHTDEDSELWKSDPHEYIRCKYDTYEEFASPVVAAQTFLHVAVKKRKKMLQKTMEAVHTILTSENLKSRDKDGALCLVGTIGDVLIRASMYKDMMEEMIVMYVYPEFNSPEGFMRARACWVLQKFSEVRFKSEVNLVAGVNLSTHCLLNDTELPVKVEAAMAVQTLTDSQEKAQKLIEPHIRPVTLELLKIIRETENDNLTTVMQKLVCRFPEQITPIAVEMTQHLAATFSAVLESDEGSDEKTMTALGLLNTIETILTVLEDQKDILLHVEGIVLSVVGTILSQAVLEFYEEALNLVYSLTCTSISPDMWKVFEMLYEMFQKEGLDYFTEMMPALHNYITVDTDAFLSNDNRLLAVYNMCKAVLTGDAGEDPECHAAKLLEVMLLQCKGRIDGCVYSFVELALERLVRDVKTSELRTMCLQVVIAALYYNPQLAFDSLEKIRQPGEERSVTDPFIRQWIEDTDCFLGLHDRKLCVLGLCTLVNTPHRRLDVINAIAERMIPSLILLFDGLKRAYENRALDEEDISDEDIDEEFGAEVLESDEDELEEESDDYLESLQKRVQTASAHSPFTVTSIIQDDDDEDDDGDDDLDDAEETALETYKTPLDDDDCPIDEYIIFKEIMEYLQGQDPAWFSKLTAHLTPEQQKNLHEVYTLADKRKAAAESKQIEKTGGYVFQNQTVPATFNFGGSLP